MRVALVTPYPRTQDPHGEEGLGGVASYAKSLADPLRGRADLMVLSPHDGPRGRRYDGDMLVHEVPRGAALSHELRELGRAGVDAVHVQFEQHLYGGPAQNLRLARALKGLRRRAGVVLTIHQVPDLDAVDRAFLRQNGFPPAPALAKAWMRLQYRALLRGSDLVIVHEDRLARRLADQYGAPADRVRVVPHGVEAAPAVMDAGEAKARIGADGKTVLLYFGFITGYKGVDLLVDALERLPPETRQDVRVVIAGKAPDRKMEKPRFRAEIESLESRIAALGPWVERRGFLSAQEIRTYLAAADLTLFPYRQVFGASGPLALAIAHERPFLVSDAFSGMGFDPRALFPRTPEGLAMKIREFLGSARLRDALALHARDLHAQRAWPRVAAATAECYREARTW